jgi:hypothetical protein
MGVATTLLCGQTPPPSLVIEMIFFVDIFPFEE